VAVELAELLDGEGGVRASSWMISPGLRVGGEGGVNGEERASDYHEMISGSGMGTMNRPPRRRYSACWARTSSRKFQARSST
jgi:hypothetical protein